MLKHLRERMKREPAAETDLEAMRERLAVLDGREGRLSEMLDATRRDLVYWRQMLDANAEPLPIPAAAECLPRFAPKAKRGPTKLQEQERKRRLGLILETLLDAGPLSVEILAHKIGLHRTTVIKDLRRHPEYFRAETRRCYDLWSLTPEGREKALGRNLTTTRKGA